MFERSQSVGVANQGQCELYRRLSDKFDIVVKLICLFNVEHNTQSENRLERQTEIGKLMDLKHPCIAAPFGFIVSATWTELKIVRTYHPIGSLEEVLQTSPSWWTMTVKSIAVVGIVLGMRFVHSFGLVSGNLKLRNILFKETHQIELVDIVTNQMESHDRKNFVGSPRKVNEVPSAFAAPEIISGHKLTQKADVFAFVSILFSIVVGHHPFEETGERSCCAEGDLTARDVIPGFVPEFVSRVILSGLATNPNDRPSFQEIFEVLKANNFRIAEDVDSEAVFAFVGSVESSES
jgi:serine/threonine protein kinase